MQLQENKIKVSVKGYIRKQLLKNLLSAHKQIADEGNVKTLIALTKFIMKLVDNFNDNIMYFGVEDGNKGTYQPPEKSQKDI